MINLPSGLSPHPPIRVRNQAENPWSEVTAAYTLVSEIEPGEGPSLRELARRFGWGTNGHKFVAQLANKLGYEVHHCRSRKATCWRLENPPENPQILSDGNALNAGENPPKKPLPPENGQSKSQKPIEKPTEIEQGRGLEAHPKPTEKPTCNCTGNSPAINPLENLQNLSNDECLRDVENPPKIPPTRAGGLAKSRKQAQAQAHAKEKIKLLTKHEHEPVHECGKVAKVILDHVNADLKSIGSTIPFSWVMQWIAMCGIKGVTNCWDLLRVARGFQEVKKPIERVIGAAMRDWAVGHTHWIKNAKANHEVNPKFAFMNPMACRWEYWGRRHEIKALLCSDWSEIYQNCYSDSFERVAFHLGFPLAAVATARDLYEAGNPIGAAWEMHSLVSEVLPEPMRNDEEMLRESLTEADNFEWERLRMFCQFSDLDFLIKEGPYD